MQTRSWLKIFLALAVFFPALAFANVSNQDLSDFLSPDEIAAEVITDSDATPIFHSASYDNPRLILLVDKARQGHSPTAQTLEIHLDGQLAYKFKVSTAKEAVVSTPAGTSYFATTPRGRFRIYARNRYHKSKKWNGAEMNFAQFFRGGIAIHATTENHYAALGSRDSGGCVRLLPKNAELVWNLVGQLGVNETEVVVYDSSVESNPLSKLKFNNDIW